MSKVKFKKKERAPSERDAAFKPLSPDLAARMEAAFAPYLKFCAALRTETDSLERMNLLARKDEMQAALIMELGKIWRDWKGRSPKTNRTDRSKLKAGRFPFGDWVRAQFKLQGETPPSHYAIYKSI
jgi:hypothetical protein